MPRLEIVIEDVFAFSDGRVVLVGAMDGSKWVADFDAELIVDGVSLGTVHIDGARMGGHRDSRLRSLETRSAVDVDRVRAAIRAVLIGRLGEDAE